MASITIGFSTRNDNPTFIEQIKKTIGVDFDVVQVINNGEKSLSQVYNEILENSKTDIIVFCHDDIVFETKKWGKKLLENFNKTDYGIIGLAGSTMMPESGKWWEQPITMRGIVNHQHEGKKWESKYSTNEGKISSVLLIDGLFIAFDKRKIKKNFDTTVEGFHFYDVTFSFSNYLEGVKVGVTYDVRVTHLSIGQTNEKWEQNREIFASKFKNELPKFLNEDAENLTTYVMCHDQDIIKSNINSGKYENMGKLVFMYVGKGEFTEIEKYPNVIIVRDLKYNIEQYPKFTAFTAWYSIWRHGLCKTKYINLLEYDTNPKEHFTFFLKNLLCHNPKVISYFPFSMRNYHFIDNPNWVTTIFKAIKSHYKIDIEPYIRSIISDNLRAQREPMWGTTNNVCFEYATFEKYMRWVAPLINHLKDDVNCGHAQERAVTFYCLLNKVPVSFYPGLIEHLQMDSHKTQGHDVDYEKSIEKLLETKQTKSKNVVAVLSRGYNHPSRYNSLIRRNILVKEKIFDKLDGDIDIIIFHEGNITPEHQSHISSATPEMPIKFVDVKRASPYTAFDDGRVKVNNDLCPPTPQSQAFPIGYKHMCHFWAIDFLEYLRDYKYVVRVDEDCFIENFDSNILKDMESNEIHFISPYFQEQDDWYVIMGLERLWESFIKKNGITPLKTFEEIRCPYTNFMIVDIENIRKNTLIKNMLNEVDKCHGIYSNRWGDLPIWGMILSTLVDSKHYLESKNISYFHGSHNKTINK